MTRASFSEPAPLTLTVMDFTGPVLGLSPTVAIRDALTASSYLDFADLTFKTSGWTTRKAALAEVGEGNYHLAGGVDPYLWTPRPDPPAYFSAEFEVPGALAVSEGILVLAALGGEEFERVLDEAGADLLGWQEVQTTKGGREIRRFNLYDQTGARITVSANVFRSTGGVITRRELV